MAGDIVTASGTKIYIGPSVLASAADTTVELAALSYVEIGLVENGGEFGDESSAVTGAALGDGRTRKAKGARDAGTLALVCFHDPLDIGQLAVEAAEATNNNYVFKVILPDRPTAGGTDTVKYFRALVMSKRQNIGTNDNILRNTYNLGINSPIYTVPAAAGS